MKKKNELTEERGELLQKMGVDVASAMMRAMQAHELTLQEGLVVISLAVSDIIEIICKIQGEDEKQMIECFCNSLKVPEV